MYIYIYITYTIHYKDELSPFKYLLWPTLVNNCHWVFIVVNMETNIITIYDSLTMKEECIKTVHKFMLVIKLDM